MLFVAAGGPFIYHAGPMKPITSICIAFATGIASLSPRAAETNLPVFYNTQEESIPFLKAGETVSRIELPAGFRATVFASEPDVQQPIGMTFDSRGRLWVAENYTYSEMPLNFDTNLWDRIVILEDSDGDGRHDSRKVFWDRAQKLTSVAVGLGGVFALCPPNLLFIPDGNRDDVPDGPPQVLLDGFEHGVIRHTLANGLRFGPDGWLYGRQGILGTSMVGRPGTAREDRVAVNVCIWRYHPATKKVEVVAQGTTNPWGADWDEHGELFFINTVIGHLWHAIPGSYFKRMFGQPLNPYVYEEIDQVADHVHWDKRERWDDIRNGITSTTSEAGGGHAHTGLLLYQGNNWPREYRNSMLTLNFHGKRINRDLIERRGATYVARHAPDLLKFNEPYFRGIDLLTGPEGAVYVADWSDIGECHDHNGIHRTSGRIYRIAHGAPAKGLEGDLAARSNVELVKLLEHPNDWHARQAREILQARFLKGENLADARGALLQFFESSGDVKQQLRALWALYSIGATRESFLADRLNAADEHLRVWGIRLLTDVEKPSQSVLEKFARMAAEDASGLVLSYLAGILQRLPLAHRWPIAMALSQRAEFNDDRVLPLMVWHGIEASVPANAEKAVALVGRSKLHKVQTLAIRRVFEDLHKQSTAADGMMQLLGRGDLAGRREAMLRAMVEGLANMQKPVAPSGWGEVSPKLLGSADASVRQAAVELNVVFGDVESMAILRQQVADPALPAVQRKRGLELLLRGKDTGLRAPLESLLTDPGLAPDAVKALGAIGGSNVAEVMLSRWALLPPAARREAIVALATRSDWALQLLNGVQRGVVERKEISAADLRQLRGLSNLALQEKVGRIWPSTEGNSQQVYAKYVNLLGPKNLKKADLVRGREVYKLSCAACHKLYGEGASIGPELTGADRQNLDYLLENILSPSSVVPDVFRVSNLNLKDDRVLGGIIVARTEQNITLQTLTDRVTIPRSEIDSIQESELSMMPDGLLENLSEEQIVDLVGYLSSTSPVTR